MKLAPTLPLFNNAYRQVRYYLALLLALFLLNACAAQSLMVHKVMLADTLNYSLQPIPKELANTGILALFTLQQQGTKHEFLLQVEITPQQMLMSGMTVEGLSLFNLAWEPDSSSLDYDHKIAIEPRRVLAELQLMLWPSAAIITGLAPAKLTITAENNRAISTASGTIYVINQQGNSTQLKNLKQGYAITVKELERWSLAEANR